ncbi:MAG: glycosyltransferase family 39 protein [Oscillatoriaceae bacterium SKW80]|nr:glycosyltransferase family 39 protein [Oscillatoriaceae bacterium SKYG93]MCX8121065.1 glycosyltransferase family 39 protein [Oscillatoriaceae bacterium SKW80]MDW8453605.1 glycosyltransferase family 39 protein [Oscillatoriaceae cyanobacterium SKYGB_i_bin93]HIK26672.1 glycosyltransferase family 39 protein [Oscillatoriaceae cyanobacterium M7585_C2015_266]
MYKKTFNLERTNERDPRFDFAIEQIWVLGLLLAAIFLYGTNLDTLPLRDWDEGIVASVAREIWRKDLNWFYPTLANQPYFNKPPLVHLLIAIAYYFGGVSEWTTRLLPAMLSALSVPLLYGIGREIFPRRTPAVFAALIYLTLLPVVRHGRLAMLDGAVLCFFLLMLWCLLRSRRDLRYALGVGIGLGLICFTKGILGLLLFALAIIFIAWDTPRLLTSGYLWFGLLFGLGPVFAWYYAQWLHYGLLFLNVHFFNQSLQRIWQPVSGNTAPPWYYLLEIVKYSWPWLLFWPSGLRLAWENRNMGWAKLVLVWVGVYFLAISIMSTKLPWYVLPVYPALALVGGAQLAEIWHWSASGKPAPAPFVYSRLWVIIFVFLALVAWISSFYFSGLGFQQIQRDVQLTLGCAALTMTVVAILIYRQDPQFILVLFWGSYISLTLFMISDHWIWELAEDYSVKPVAAVIQRYVPEGAVVYTSHPYHRPSLNFYSERQVIPTSNDQILRHWQQDLQPYLLLDKVTKEKLQLENVRILGTAADWTLLSRTAPNPR